MRHVKHKVTIVLVAAALVGSFWLGASTQRTTQAAAPPAPRAVVEPAAFIEMRPIVPAEVSEAARGKNALDSTSRTDW